MTAKKTAGSKGKTKHRPAMSRHPRRAVAAGAAVAAVAGGVGLRVRMYRVGFGDFFLVTVPSGEGPQHILIDCGVFIGKADLGTLAAAIDDMATETGKKLSLIIATHRHYDHISGFGLHADLFSTFEVGGVWMPVWETEDASVQRAQADLAALAQTLQMNLAAREDDTGRAMLDMLYNATGVEPFGVAKRGPSNADALRQLKQGFGVEPSYYAAGDVPELPAALAAAGLEAQILGPPPVDKPEFQRLESLRKGVGEYLDANGATTEDGASFEPFGSSFQVGAAAYPAEAFSEFARRGDADPRACASARLAALLHDAQPDVIFEAVKRIDQHINNQSLVVLFTFHEKKLLFAGDAQAGNWEYWLYGGAQRSSTPSGELAKGSAAILSSIDFYKVGHHGSTNATPIPALEAMREGTTAMCSTQPDVYGSVEKHSEVPRVPLLHALAETGAVVRSEQIDVAVDGIRVARAEEAPAELPEPAEGRFQVGPCYIDYFL